MHSSIIAADIGGSHISSVPLYAQNWTIDQQAICQTKTNSFGDKETILKNWISNLEQSASKGNIQDKYQFAIALPGPFDYENGLFQQHPEGKLGSLVGTSFKKILRPHFGQDLKISFENDAACFGLGEACFGLSKNHDRSIGITLGTGIGSSFIANQTIVKEGKNLPQGGELYAASYQNGIADDYFSTRWFVQQAQKDLSLQINGVRELLQEADREYLQQVFKKFATNLHQFLLPYAKKFNASTIIVGGNISKAWSYYGPTLTALFAKEAIKIQPSVLNEQAIMLGAAKVFTQQFST